MEGFMAISKVKKESGRVILCFHYFLLLLWSTSQGSWDKWGSKINLNFIIDVLNWKDAQAQILDLIGYVVGTFPFRYLGNPLNSKRISLSDCDRMVDHIIQMIRVWSTRHLSYAARATLVNSVLLGMHSYWDQIFVIPKKVMAKVVSICRNFLWEGNYINTKMITIAWNKVCKPNSCGGLGLRDCVKWNIAALGTVVWQIALKADNLWVKWVHAVYIKGRD